MVWRAEVECSTRWDEKGKDAYFNDNGGGSSEKIKGMELCTMLEISHAMNEEGKPGFNVVEENRAVGTFFGQRESDIDLEIRFVVFCIPPRGLMKEIVK